MNGASEVPNAINKNLPSKPACRLQKECFAGPAPTHAFVSSRKISWANRAESSRTARTDFMPHMQPVAQNNTQQKACTDTLLMPQAKETAVWLEVVFECSACGCRDTACVRVVAVRAEDSELLATYSTTLHVPWCPFMATTMYTLKALAYRATVQRSSTIPSWMEAFTGEPTDLRG